MMSILSNTPDHHKGPQQFIDFLSTTIKIYDGNAQDLWALLQQALTLSEYAHFTECFDHNNFTAFANAVAQDQQQQDDILAAPSAILAKPIDLACVLEFHPESKESPEDFLECFRECYESYSSDLARDFNAINAQYNSMLLNCLLPSVATVVKTNDLDCVEAAPN
ncbi:hypothetical protein chiPu_0025302 [Chiloscyllium punctatum]|uniref:Uncharacterized protein n=1 Tax=Chiloscyllium punctatum TaxID=137246 RepID=A0A401TFN0_CHIPU|nr:hypothetical protein [Chiloscyllium punctatum]